MFSPRVETTGAETAVFDVDGLERLFGGYTEIGEQIQQQTRARGIQANVALASNADAAVCAARGFSGLTVIERGTEAARLRDLPLTVLAPPPEVLETLQRWGIRALGAFAKLPSVEIAARLGQQGVKLHQLACGAGARPIVPHVETLRFMEAMDLDYDITAIEPLTFILSRMLDHICSRMRSRNLATHEVHLTLGTYTRVLNLPVPVRNARLLTKLFILDLEAHPPGMAVQRVEVEAIPVKPRVVQNGLFVPLSPEPEKLELTIARLKAVVGEGNVGSPEILDTHRPDAIAIHKFKTVESLRERVAARRPGEGGNGKRLAFSPSPGLRPLSPRGRGTSFSSLSLTLRLFRPPLEATVQLGNSIPIWLAFHGLHGSIATACGPWRTSGDWWRPSMWDREEWDIEVGDTLYRIYYDVHLDRWYAQGVYD
jgi:protein ImuB